MKPKTPQNETKHEKFIRLANSRTNKVLKSITVLGNLSHPQLYKYSPKDVDKITNVLYEKVEWLEAVLTSYLPHKIDEKFTFDD